MKYLFQKIKSPLLPFYLFLRAHFLERRRWKHAEGNDECRVFYGLDRIPAKDELTSGGIVKFQDLQDLFPNTPTRPNLLYFVTSSLPHCSDILLKYARKNGAKFLLNQNGVAYSAWHGPGWEKVNKPMALLLKEADYVFYQSEFCKISADRFLGKRDSKYEILYNPVDTRHFIPEPESVKVVEEKLRLLMMGSYHEKYRIKVALHVLEKVRAFIPNVHLTIAGRCVWRSSEKKALDEMDKMVRDLDLLKKFTFIGAYTQEDALKIYQDNHILLHTTYNDACPRVPVEAMSCGLPVVYSSSGGLPELVGDDAGIGIDAPLDWDKNHAPDPAHMAEAISKIVSSYASYSKEARNRAVERFDVRPWIRRHEEIFRELLG